MNWFSPIFVFGQYLQQTFTVGYFSEPYLPILVQLEFGPYLQPTFSVCYFTEPDLLILVQLLRESVFSQISGDNTSIPSLK